MTNIGYILSIAVFIIFAFGNIFIRDNILAGALELAFIFPMLYGFLNLRYEQNIVKNAFFANILLFLSMLAILFLFDFQGGVIFWALLFPFVAANLSDEKWRLRFIILFNLIVYAGAYYYWQGSDGMMIKYIRFVTVSVIISVLVCFYEKSISNGFKKQEELNESLINSVHEIKKLAITDSLTSLYNKRHFDTIFNEEFNRAKRAQEPFVLAILDIDNFKLYNDTYGHSAGNDALVSVANVLKEQTMRSGDFSFRIGGEEFAIILQSSFLEDIRAYFDNLREKIATLNIEHINNKPYNILTVSIGIVVVLDYKRLNLIDAYNKADENLYMVKNSGRNKVILSMVMDSSNKIADTVH